LFARKLSLIKADFGARQIYLPATLTWRYNFHLELLLANSADKFQFAAEQ